MKFPLVSLALLTLAAAGMALTPAAPSLADHDHDDSVSRTVTVTAVGKTIVAPSFLTMQARLSVGAERAEEAVRGFAQARERAAAGLADGNIEGLDIRSGGAVFEARSGAGQHLGVICVEQLDVRFSPTGNFQVQSSEIASAMDLAVELGLQLQSSSPAGFDAHASSAGGGAILGELSAADRASAEGATHVAAMERALGMATHIAGLSGHAVGDAVAIELGKAEATWLGVGRGFEVTSSMTVTYEMH